MGLGPPCWFNEDECIAADNRCTTGEELEVILGVMQPYFLPYFEHFRLLAACDRWVVFDVAQFTRKSWITRNRILNRDKGTAYISVPVRHTGLSTRIGDAALDCGQNWRRSLLDRLLVYRSDAPHFAQVNALLTATLAEDFQTISQLNIALLKMACEHLAIKTPISFCSELPLDLPSGSDPGEWALHISKRLGATEYRNPSGGKSLFDESQYARHGIKLTFHEHRPITYLTGSFQFVPDLSIVDWMMWNDVETLQAWLR